MRQTVITIVAKTKDERIYNLRCLLAGDTYPIPFSQFPSLHFSSMTMTEGQKGPVYFIWESNFDGPISSYLQLAVDVAGRQLRRLYEHCADYAGADSDLYDYLKARVVKPAAYHIGAPGLSVSRIEAEHVLAEKLEDLLDDKKVGSVEDGSMAQEYLQRRVSADPELRWAKKPEERLSWLDVTWRWVSLALVITLFLAVALLLLPGVAAAACLLRVAEWREDPGSPVPKDLDRLLRHEDHGVQNHLASVIDVKPGRRLLLRFLLWGNSFIVRVQTKGTLSKIPGIFFAHWSLIDNGKKLLFLTNYTGGWDSYLDDFIDLASSGLTPVWTNTKGFPKTRLLYFGGSRDRTAFKRYVRNHQMESRVWYRAYRDLTLANVLRNSAIRDGLFRRLEGDDQLAWLRLL